MSSKEWSFAPQGSDSSSLTGSLIEMAVALRRLFVNFWPSEIYTDFRMSVKKLTGRGEIKSSEILSLWSKDHEGENIGLIKERFFMSIFYCLRAEREIADGNLETATPFLINAAYHLGYLDGHQSIVSTAEFSSKGPSRGGQANKNIRADVERYLSELVSKPPKGDWKSHQDVADQLKERIDSYVLEKGWGKVIQDSEAFIKTQLGRNTESRAAYRNKKAVSKKTGQ